MSHRRRTTWLNRDGGSMQRDTMQNPPRRRARALGVSRALIWTMTAAAGLAGACSGGNHGAPPTTTDPNAGTTTPPPPPPFQADHPFTYVAKVKNLLLGLPPTNDEVQQVMNDPGAL